MFLVESDKTINITRGDSIEFSAPVDYSFQAGDVLRLKVFRKKACEDVVLQKDFTIEEATETVNIALTEQDTRIGDVISKPVDYWYEFEVNPDNNPQTILGYDDDGAKIFRLYPAGRDIEDDELTKEEFATLKAILNGFKENEIPSITQEYVDANVISSVVAPNVWELKPKRMYWVLAYANLGKGAPTILFNGRRLLLVDVDGSNTVFTLFLNSTDNMPYDIIAGTISSEGELIGNLRYVENGCNKVTAIDENSTDEQYPSAKATYDEIQKQTQDKQGTLVSGQNIKTINGKSILGSGDMVIVGGVEGDINTVVLEDINEIKNSIGNTTYIQDITDTFALSNGYYNKTTGVFASKADANGTEIFPVTVGEKYFVTGAYGFFAALIVAFDENNTYLADKSVFSSENANTNVDDYEYIVPEGVAYIGCSTRLAGTSVARKNLIVKKEFTELNNVKELVRETAQEVADTVSYNVKNVCPNGNFEDTSGWTTLTGVTLTVADNVATVTRVGNGSSAKLTCLLDKDLFPHKQDDVYFISAKLKTPKNQKNCGIAINTNSNDGYEEIGKGTSTYDEYTTVYGVKRFKTNFAGGWSFIISAGVNYNVTDFTFQLKEVTLIKVADTSYTDEEIKNIYSAILEQNGGYIDGTVNVAGVGGTLKTLGYEYANESIITKTKTVTVGANGDFQTINSALRYLSKFYPAYLDGGIECEVKILDGTIINEQIRLERIDLSHISITTDNADNTVQVDVTGWGGVTHDTRGNKPFFSAEYGARLPCIKCLFSCIVPEGGWVTEKYTDENGKEVETNMAVGYFCNRGSTGIIAGETTYSGSVAQGLANVGFENFYDNIIANNNSEIVLREAIARNAGRYGVMARHISRVSARSADITGCADTAAYADRSSMMDVRFADVSGSNNGLQCYNTSNMTAVETIAKNITNIVADSREGSVLNCAEMTIDNVKDVFRVLNGGTIIAVNSKISNHSSVVYNVDVNTLNVDGVIYAE